MKTVLITGASKGIGKALALGFANNGYAVGINYNKSNKEAQEVYREITQKGGTAILLKADVSVYSEVQVMVQTFIESFGHIDVLINNAGITAKGLFIEEGEMATNSIINTNLVGCINVSKEAIKSMVSFEHGKIINISSIWGNVGASMEATYSATKAGIIGLTKSLAKEYGYSNITVNAICPGVVDTDMNKNLTSQERADLESMIMFGRFGKPQEVCDLALFLAEKGDYLTGQVITIDGGFTL